MWPDKLRDAPESSDTEDEADAEWVKQEKLGANRTEKALITRVVTMTEARHSGRASVAL